ncbi:MAG TPA: DUF1501 domain-containing protein [Pirellulales bacterium]|jgi:hypothetical protein
MSGRSTFNGRRGLISRRDYLRAGAAGATALTGASWLPKLAADSAHNPQRRRSCILLWMSGGPSQMDTFDLKPGHENGGPFKEIDTAVPGIRISEHLPKLARAMQDIAIIRSMKTREGDHTRATYQLRTGHLPQGSIAFPTLGSLVSKELGEPESELPNFVSVAPFRILSPAAYSAGFLGPEYGPVIVGSSDNFGGMEDNSLAVRNLERADGIVPDQLSARLDLLQPLEENFLAEHPDLPVASHRSAYQGALRMMQGPARDVFDLSNEPAALRDSYGRSKFGQGCLLARRLVERGVPFVEVSLNGVPGANFFGWDTHQQNFEATKGLSGVLDPAWATLMSDLKSRGLLESTLIVWMGEFGRTPKINGQQGRDHFPAAWTTVLAGGGVRGGQVIGRTSADGMTVEDRPVTVPDLLATICRGLGIDPMGQNASNVGRPIRIVEPEAKAIQEALA